MIRIGVLGLQGGVIEHLEILEGLQGVEGVWVSKKEDFQGLDGLILPGGESTTLGKLLDRLNLMALIKDKINLGLPIWGTCAGMILLANQIEGQEISYLDSLDVTVSRNAFGRQLDSFDREDVISAISDQPIQMRFIRAPKIVKWNPEKVQILYQIDNYPVAVRQGNLLATSFHPELVGEKKLHQYFVDLITKNQI